MTRLKVAVISESAGNWPLYVAQDKGYFAAEGLEVEFTVTRSSVKHMEDLKAGGVYDIGIQAADHIIRAVEAGSDLFMLLGVSTPNQSLIVRPDIRSYADLRGRKIGVDGLATGFALLLRGLLWQNGLQEGRDYELVQVGGTGERFDAVLEGVVAGAFLDGPTDLVAESQGFHRLGGNLDYVPEYQGTVAATRRSWARANEAAALRFIRAYVAASDWLHQREHREEASDILCGHLPAGRDLAARTYDRYMQSRTFNPRARLNVAGVSAAMKVMAATGQLPGALGDPSRYYDLSLYERAMGAL